MTRASSRTVRMASTLLRIGCASTLILAANGRAAMAQDTKEIRLTPDSFDFSRAAIAGAGTSGLAGIRTIVLKGDPTRSGLYTILLRVPAHTRIAAHRHPDDRIATVVAGTWYFGYGHTADTTALRALPPGSFYTEPPNEDHFAETRDTDVMVQITGLGPTGTVYASTKKDPRR